MRIIPTPKILDVTGDLISGEGDDQGWVALKPLASSLLG
jgi:hypothetical protein